jgi:hypothetical protein
MENPVEESDRACSAQVKRDERHGSREVATAATGRCFNETYPPVRITL